MIAATLDLIPMACSAYGAFIYVAVAALINARGLGNDLHAASFFDSGSNVAAAKTLLTPGDHEPCFNRNLKYVIDDVVGARHSRSSRTLLLPRASLHSRCLLRTCVARTAC